MRADLLRAAAGRPVLATPVMREADRTAMIAAPPTGQQAQTRPTARVAPPPRRGNAWVAVALTLLGVLAVGALGIGLYVANHNKTEVPVPDLKGRTAVDANQLVVSAKLKPEPSNVTDPSCTQNTVIDQNPAAQTKVNEGAPVQYRVCAGPGSTSVPQLKGLTKADAEAALKANNLVANFTTVSSGAPANTVIDSDPKSGTAVQANSTVRVTVSDGKLKNLPNVVNSSADDARGALQSAGFNNIKEVQRDTADPNKVGVVLDQDPNGNTTQDPTKITVTIFVGHLSTPTGGPTSAPPSPTATPSAKSGG
jgi:beta-lactam-binding protein with PASTA domain